MKAGRGHAFGTGVAIVLIGVASVTPGSTGEQVESSEAQSSEAPETTALGPRPINIQKQLMVTDLRVVEDRLRTDPRNGRRAVWTFKYLMENMAGGNDPAQFVMRWLRQWERDQMINGHVSPARPRIREQVIDPWLRASGGRRLDLAKAPLQLLAIVNRIDLRNHDRSSVRTAGEGRFVFGVLDPDGAPLLPSAGPAPGGFLVILEYEMPAHNMDELREWARLWERLGRHALGSPEYNDALERVTRRFSDRGSAPQKPNGNALNQIRTNEISLAPLWELREFVISDQSGFLRQHTVAITPSTIDLNGTENFRDLINMNESAILDGSFDLTQNLFGASSLSGPFQASDFPDFADRTFTVNPIGGPFLNIPWSAAGINNNDARHTFALNTCGGCHRDETGTGFIQVGFPPNHELPRRLGAPAALAGFLRGIETPDPVDPTVMRRFDDLERRRHDFERLLGSFGGPKFDGPGPVQEIHEPRFVH